MKFKYIEGTDKLYYIKANGAVCAAFGRHWVHKKLIIERIPEEELSWRSFYIIRPFVRKGSLVVKLNVNGVMQQHTIKVLMRKYFNKDVIDEDICKTLNTEHYVSKDFTKTLKNKLKIANLKKETKKEIKKDIMAQRSNSWTESEDSTIYSMVRAYPQNYFHAFEEAEKVLTSRTYAAINQRWYSVLRFENKVTAMVSSNGSSTLNNQKNAKRDFSKSFTEEEILSILQIGIKKLSKSAKLELIKILFE